MLKYFVQTAFHATAEKVKDLETERDAVPSVDSIRQDLNAVKQEINHNKDEIRDCKVREHDLVCRSLLLTFLLSRPTRRK